MDPAHQELYSLLVPLHQHRLIVPRVCVSEVVRYLPAPPPDGAPDWLRGMQAWNGRDIPVISFEALAGLPVGQPGGRTRVAVFTALTGALEAGAFGVMTEGFPQLVRVNRGVMEPDSRHPWPDDGPVICQIRMINEYPLIPDLEVVEQLLQASLATGTQPV